MKNAYQDHIQACVALVSTCSKIVEELPNKKVGGSLMTGEETDLQIQHYLSDLRSRGCIVNIHIIITVGEGILSSTDPRYLAVNRGGIQLTKDWAKVPFSKNGIG